MHNLKQIFNYVLTAKLILIATLLMINLLPVKTPTLTIMSFTICHLN